jgi:hypothetical protein
MRSRRSSPTCPTWRDTTSFSLHLVPCFLASGHTRALVAEKATFAFASAGLIAHLLANTRSGDGCSGPWGCGNLEYVTGKAQRVRWEKQVSWSERCIGIPLHHIVYNRSVSVFTATWHLDRIVSDRSLLSAAQSYGRPVFGGVFGRAVCCDPGFVHRFISICTSDDIDHQRFIGRTTRWSGGCVLITDVTMNLAKCM